MRHAIAIAAFATLAALGACERVGTVGTADQQAASQQEDLAKRAQDEVGIYQPTHFTRKRLANRIGQMLDDPALATISYAQALDGRLHCIGHTIGFPLPGATQTTNPEHLVDADLGQYRGNLTLPQPEPDQLFSPATMDATWILLVNPKTGQAAPAYFEGHVQTFLADNKPDASLIAQDCTS